MTKTKLDMIQKLKDTSQIVTSERKLKVNSRKEANTYTSSFICSLYPIMSKKKTGKMI